MGWLPLTRVRSRHFAAISYSAVPDLGAKPHQNVNVSEHCTELYFTLKPFKKVPIQLIKCRWLELGLEFPRKRYFRISNCRKPSQEGEDGGI